MASEKEAIAIVLDVGPSMDSAAEGDRTKLQESIDCIHMILQRKLFSESKDEVSLILIGSDETANELADDDSYNNISVARPLATVTWPFLEFVQNDISPTDNETDFLDGIVVAADHLRSQTMGKRGFVSSKIILFSDLAGPVADNQLDAITKSLKSADIALNVIGVDPDEDESDEDRKPPQGGAGPSTAPHRKPKTPQQKLGEKIVNHILEAVDGECYTFSETWEFLSNYQSKSVRPTAWKCQLDIAENVKIPINAYIRVKEAKSKGFKTVYAKDPESTIIRESTHHLNDEEETEVERKDMVQGHRYGSTLVPFSDEDLQAMKFRSEKCFQVLGFTSRENVNRYMFMGDSTMIVHPEKGDEVAAAALSSLIKACQQMNKVVIVRRCYSASSSPKIGVLEPDIDEKKNRERFFYHDLPFAEDVRRFTMSTLPYSEETITDYNDKFKPSDDQLDVVDGLIDSMMLVVKDEDGEKIEEKKPKNLFNPYLQRLYHCLNHRANDTTEALPGPSDRLVESLEMSERVKEASNNQLKKVKETFPLKRVAKAKGKDTADNVFNIEEKDAEGESSEKKPRMDDVELSDLQKEKVDKIGTVTPVEDFLAILSQKDRDRYDEACEMIRERIIQLVFDSFGSQLFSKAIDCLRAYRAQTLKHSEPRDFNKFLFSLKESLFQKNKKAFWKLMIEEKLGLVTKLESEESSVTKAEGDDFLTEVVEEKIKEEAPPKEDADELLDMM
ncbi:DgyrCDS13862 [Dimorphilus gyrociliatus]|uniref:ATP-dependent DNA helicase II subunit 2 n=1 Tax=Dimorphilus gyrociliatus TaxID=2664684 RepID=A0A7I8WBY9_9ANNE|nr:DgyrCDS13862 [Dimorphilus gyrociliatus]